VKIKDRFDYENRFWLAEAIDDKSFYSNANRADDLIGGIGRARKKEQRILEFMDGLSFNLTDLGKWFDRQHDCRLIDKQKENKAKSDHLAEIYKRFLANPSKRGVDELICFFQKEAGMKPKRREVVASLQHCLRNYPEDMTVYEAMYETRNAIRRGGRKIQGRCIGTTLLTKGLEFDTVIVLDAHRFEDSKNFYVAISRACKRLVIISKTPTLHFVN
jgi:DNA helicase-2/ATP-dependent DNA helicase PcrA